MMCVDDVVCRFSARVNVLIAQVRLSFDARARHRHHIKANDGQNCSIIYLDAWMLVLWSLTSHVRRGWVHSHFPRRRCPRLATLKAIGNMLYYKCLINPPSFQGISYVLYEWHHARWRVMNYAFFVCVCVRVPIAGSGLGTSTPFTYIQWWILIFFPTVWNTDTFISMHNFVFFLFTVMSVLITSYFTLPLYRLCH